MNNTIAPGLPFIPATLPTRPTAPSGNDVERGFGDTVKDAINQVNELGNKSDQSVSQLVQGDRQDVHNVMIAVEKADIAFQLMMQVRNKIVNAYQEVSKLQF
jgi:flagellar hook-basal body complex protein FliE